MHFTQFFLFLLLLLISEPTNGTNRSFLRNHQQLRMKRSPSDESIEMENNQDDEEEEEEEAEEILLNAKSRTTRKNGQTLRDSPDIQRILSKKENDYYGILNLNHQATREDIISAYKKLSLRVHPDKFNTPGATQATQRLNKARSELLKKFESTKSNDDELTTRMSRSRSTMLNENDQTDIIEEPDSISTPMSDSNNDKNQGKPPNPMAGYILLGFILFIIAMIIFIICWIKRKRSSTDEIKSSKEKKSRAYDSPNSDEGGTKNRDSEVSILQDEE